MMRGLRHTEMKRFINGYCSIRERVTEKDETQCYK